MIGEETEVTTGERSEENKESKQKNGLGKTVKHYKIPAVSHCVFFMNSL